METKDIMVDLNGKELEELGEMYRLHEDELPHVYSFLQTCIKARKSGMSDFVSVMSPENCWHEDGTFFALMPNSGFDIFVHSLDASGKNILKGLLSTQRLKAPPNQKRYTQIMAIHHNFYPIIKDVVTNRLGGKVVYEQPMNMYILRKEKAAQVITTPLPGDVYIKEIDPSEAKVIEGFWHNKYPGSVNKLADWIKLNGGYGLYLKSNDQLVSCVLLSPLGQQTALQTLEGYKQKGYARIIAERMTKKIAEDGFHCFVSVRIGNRASEIIYARLGFEKFGTCEYIGIEL